MQLPFSFFIEVLICIKARASSSQMEAKLMFNTFQKLEFLQDKAFLVSKQFQAS